MEKVDSDCPWRHVNRHLCLKQVGLYSLFALGGLFLSAILLHSIVPVKICFADEFEETAMATTVLTELAKGSVERRRPASSQLIVVQNNGGSPQTSTVHALEKNATGWITVLAPMQAMTGRKGFAAAADKREGDGRTPMGVYPLGIVFGYAPGINSAMPYRQMTGQDIWVDDPGSPDYNTLKKKGETTARSFEDMVLPDDRYKYGIVVEYNTNPVVPGRGSAIFIHIWKDDKTATSGCVALSEENILKLIRWLDPAKNPMIVLAR